MKFRILEPIIAFAFAISNIDSAAGTNLGDSQVPKKARDYVVEFRRGAGFDSNEPLSGLVVNRRIEKSELALLRRELDAGVPEVRQNIVKLLEKIGLALDPAPPGKISIIRDHSIIRTLLTEGFAKDDAAASTAAVILRERCAPADLAAFSDLYVKSLKQQKGDYLYLAAKAKSMQARLFVEDMAKSPAWTKYPERVEVVRIAQAALGNSAVENEFIEATLDAEMNAPAAPTNPFFSVGAAKDGSNVAAQLGLLGFIGTKRSLLSVCKYLRSPLKSYVPNVSERSIRYDALDAIRYNFPDELVLYNPTTLGEWAAAERFCTENIGAVFEGPTPDIPADVLYPTNQIRGPRRIQK